MDKRVFAADYAAVDREIERLKPLMAMGGYIPCPDHRIPPDAKYENVQYYCDRMQSCGCNSRGSILEGMLFIRSGFFGENLTFDRIRRHFPCIKAAVWCMI